MAKFVIAERAQAELLARFGGTPGIQAIGVTRDEAGEAYIRINIDASMPPAVRNAIPTELDGVSVELRAVRNMRAFAY